MEHVMNIAISIDDEGIEQKATDYCVKKLYEDMKGKLLNDGYYQRGALTGAAEDIVTKWLDDHKDEIITQTATLVAEKISRRKAFKEKVGDVK